MSVSLALVTSIDALAQDGDNEAIARQTVDMLTEFCLPSLSASEVQSSLLDSGWSRVGGVPTAAGPDAEDLARKILEDANAISDGWRFFDHADFSQIISFTTPDDEPEVLKDCLVDGPSIEPTSLVSILIDDFGVPVRGKPGVVHWPDWRESGHILIIARSNIVNHEEGAGVLLALRKTDTPGS